MRISDWSSDVCSSDLYRRVQLEVGPRLAGCIDVIAQRAAARLQRVAQRLPDGGRQCLAARQRNRAGRRTRVDAGPEQRLRSIDIAHSYDNMSRQQGLLDGQGFAL